MRNGLTLHFDVREKQINKMFKKNVSILNKPIANFSLLIYRFSIDAAVNPSMLMRFKSIKPILNSA